jgi:hypothetical protein
MQESGAFSTPPNHRVGARSLAGSPSGMTIRRGGT